MTAYIVTIATPPGTRYIDSLWIDTDCANHRVDDLKREFGRSGKTVRNDEWWAWKNEIEIQDAELYAPPPRDAKGHFSKKGAR